MVLRHSKTAATRASTTASVTCGASPCAARDSRTMTRTLSRSICLASFGSPTRSAMFTCPSIFRLGRQAWRFRHTDVGSRANRSCADGREAVMHALQQRPAAQVADQTGRNSGSTHHVGQGQQPLLHQHPPPARVRGGPFRSPEGSDASMSVRGACGVAALLST